MAVGVLVAWRFRAGPGKTTEIPPMLAAPPVLTRYTVADV